LFHEVSLLIMSMHELNDLWGYITYCMFRVFSLSLDCVKIGMKGDMLKFICKK